MQFEFVYYVDNEKKIKRTCDLATLQKLAIIRSDYWVDGVMDIKPEFVDVNNIEIDPSLNIAQAGGNTPQEIGQYTNVFDEELFQPFLDGLPLVRKNEDGSYTTIGGYKRILGKKRSQRKDEISPNVPVLVVTFDKEKEAKAILTLNSIENSPTNTKKPAKKYRSKESLARSLNAMLEQDGLDINDENMSDAVLDGYLAPLKVSYENLTRKQISDEAKRLKGAYVPEPLTSDEIVQEMDRQLRKFYPNALFVGYSVNKKAVAQQDRIEKFLNAVNDAVQVECDTVVTVVQHTGVSSVDELLNNKRYLTFEEGPNGTVKQFSNMFYNAELKVDAIFGVINDGKITLQKTKESL